MLQAKALVVLLANLAQARPSELAPLIQRCSRWLGATAPPELEMGDCKVGSAIGLQNETRLRHPLSIELLQVAR